MSSSITAQRAHFPTLHQEVNNKSLVYLDSAASAHKPSVVIERVDTFIDMKTQRFIVESII